MVDAIKSAGVVGLGVMGFDIAFLYAQQGYRTLAYDAAEKALKSVAARRDRTIERLRKRDRISGAQIENVMHGLQTVQEIASLSEVDLITEAVSESADTKTKVYGALHEAGFGGLLTTNTSALTRASLLAGSVYPGERFASTHFFNPVPYTQMVEVVRGDMADSSYATLRSFLADLGRQPVETEDISGFVSNSVLMTYAVMALRLIESGAAIEAVDGAAKELGALPPLVSFDSWKPAIVEDVTRVMYGFRGDAFLRSSKLLPALAQSNPLFYVDRKPNAAVYELVAERGAGVPLSMVKLALITSVRLAAARTVELGEAPATVDFVCTEGLKFTWEPLAGIDEAGAAAVLKDLQTVNDAIPNGMNAPGLLEAMAREKENFFVGGRANPWLAAHLGMRGDVRC